MVRSFESYEEVVHDFSLEVPEHFNFATDVVDRFAADTTHTALIWVSDDDRQRLEYSFRDIRDASYAVARWADGAGLTPGDRVLVIMPRLPAWWQVMVGLTRAGCVPIPGTTQLRAKDIAYRIAEAEITGAVVSAEHASLVDEADNNRDIIARLCVGSVSDEWDTLDAVLHDTSPWTGPATRADDPGLVYFTSGTTGAPKMVLHTQASYPLGHTITGRYWLAVERGDVHWNLSDNGWAKAAWSSLYGPWSQGATLFVHDGRGKFNAVQTLEMLARHKITSFCAPPTAYRALVQHDVTQFDLSALRSCIGAGEPLNPEVIDAWRDMTGLAIRDGYGQTETTILAGNFPGVPVRPGSMGKPAPGVTVEIIDDEGAVQPPATEGHIGVRVKPDRPVGLLKEYWKNAEENEKRFVGEWYYTGDRAYKDDDGYIWFVGRADDVIISAGYRIGPFEVESALIEHPAVVEAAVVGTPDPERTQIVTAYIILADGYNASDKLAAELQEFVKNQTAPYKYPRRIEFVTELPKTISGKIRRVALRGAT